MVFREALEKKVSGGCEVVGCDHKAHTKGGDPTLYLHARCHPASALEVSYTAGSGCLKIACLKCHQVVAEVAVASEK
jgi:hypothetical protein